VIDLRFSRKKLPTVGECWAGESLIILVRFGLADSLLRVIVMSLDDLQRKRRMTIAKPKDYDMDYATVNSHISRGNTKLPTTTWIFNLWLRY